MAADFVPVTLIVAPPGSGKSGLLAQWAITRREPVAWLSLDARDNSLAAFSTVLAHAINAVEPETVVSALAYLEFATAAPDPEIVATHLLNDLADVTADLTIILDDTHVITDPAANAVIETLATASMPGLRLLIGARADPPWRLALLRGSGRLLELRPPDLRLTPAEITEYAAGIWRTTVEPEAGEALWSQCGGWLTGVRFLCAGPRRPEQPGGKRPVDIARFSEAMGWLLNETLSCYPPLASDLLPRLAVPERVNAGLAEALSGGLCSPDEARSAYDALVEDGLFLARAADEGWSQIHAHVRQALLARLTAQEGVPTVDRLHELACDWFISQGHFDDAMVHAEASGDPRAVANVLRVAVEPMLSAERWQTIEQWLARLPQQVIDQDAELLVAASWTVRQRDDRLRAQALAQEATRRIAGNSLLSERARDALTAEVTAIEASVLYMLGDTARARTLAGEAIARLPPEKGYALAETHLTQALCDFHLDPAGATERISAALSSAAILPPRVYLQLWAALGFTTFQQGEMLRTLKVAAQMRSLGAAQRSPSIERWGDLLSALASYERNDIEAAVAFATAILQHPQGVHRIAVREALGILAMSYEARRQHEDADLTLGRMEEFLLDESTVRHLLDVEGLRAVFALHRGDHDRARAWYERAILPEPDYSTHSSADARVAHLRIAVSLGIELDHAVERIASILKARAMFDTLLREIELLLLLAIGSYRLGDVGRARSVLADAIARGHHAGLTRVFLDLGEDLMPLLEDVIALEIPYVDEATRLRDLAAEELVAKHAVPRRADAALRDARAEQAPLTEREQEVLQLVATRLTNKEIGSLLRISPLTVKRHTINIYAKLGVRTRNQAIDLATRTGLLNGLPTMIPGVSPS